MPRGGCSLTHTGLNLEGSTTVSYEIKIAALKWWQITYVLFFICMLGEDEEEMEHQEEGREQLSETEDSGEDELGSDHGETTQKKLKGRPCPKRLFTFCLVNSYGTADLNSLAADGKLLKLNCKHFL